MIERIVKVDDKGWAVGWSGELIRCKDCKHGGSDGGCDFLSTLTLYPVNTDSEDYCSAWAERETE